MEIYVIDLPIFAMVLSLKLEQYYQCISTGAATPYNTGNVDRYQTIAKNKKYTILECTVIPHLETTCVAYIFPEGIVFQANLRYDVAPIYALITTITKNTVMHTHISNLGTVMPHAFYDVHLQKRKEYPQFSWWISVADSSKTTQGVVDCDFKVWTIASPCRCCSVYDIVWYWITSSICSIVSQTAALYQSINKWVP